MIKEFDTMFPRCLYVANGTNYEELTDKFDLFIPDNENPVPEGEDWINENTFGKQIAATVYLAKEKKNGNVGYLVILNEKEIDEDTCVHEASHVLTHLEKYFGLESGAQEYRAYTMEWITRKIREAWKEYKNTGK